MYEELLLDLDRRQRELVFRRLEYEDSQLITVWQMRYGRSHRGKTIPDAFLDTFTDLFFLKNRWSETILKKGIKKELLKAADVMGLSEWDKKGSALQDLLVQEYANTVMLFAELGKGDRAYGHGILNLTPLDEKKYFAKLTRDVTALTADFPEAAGMSILFSPLKRGAYLGIECYKEHYLP